MDKLHTHFITSLPTAQQGDNALGSVSLSACFVCVSVIWELMQITLIGLQLIGFYLAICFRRKKGPFTIDTGHVAEIP